MTGCDHQWGAWGLWQHLDLPHIPATFQPEPIEIKMPPATRDRMCVKCHMLHRQEQGTMKLTEIATETHGRWSGKRIDPRNYRK